MTSNNAKLGFGNRLLSETEANSYYLSKLARI